MSAHIDHAGHAYSRLKVHIYDVRCYNDVMERRKRFSRARNTGAYIISRSDVELLTLLSRYRYLRQTFLCSLTGRSVRSVNYALRKLFDNGYINKPREQRRGYNTLYSPDIYELDEKGRNFLCEQAPEVTRLLRQKSDAPVRQFAHAMMICDATASIEIGVRASACTFIGWQEVVARCAGKRPLKLPCTVSHTFGGGKTVKADTFIIPDGLFGIRYPNAQVSFFALEAEHYNPIEPTTLNRASFLKKLLAYRDVIRSGVYKKQLNIPNLRVLVVAPTPTRIQHMVELTERMAKQSNLFLFHDIPVQEELFKAPPPFPELFTGKWLRAGTKPARIDQT